jgi:DNA polymerase III epsilon subunit-like protein
MNVPGKFLFFDTETDALGRMSAPVTQTLMQLAWVVTDADGDVLVTQNRLVQGATRVGKYAPHGITPQHVAAHGDPPAVVLADFIRDAKDVTAAGGRLVAHNAGFDVGVLEHAGADLEALKPAVFCTIKDMSIMTYIGARTARGSLKYPKLSEVFVKLFGQDPGETLHDALGDTHVLRKCFHELVRLGVVSFTPSVDAACAESVEERADRVKADVVQRADCDVYINASDVATLGGLMDKFNRHPYEVAERVLLRHAKHFGVGGRGAQVAVSEAEVKVEAMNPAGGKCATTSELGKREREMHSEIDARKDITPDVAREAKRIVTSRLASSFGVVQEERVIQHHGITQNNARPYHLRVCTRGGLTYGLVGRIDGFVDGQLVEVKNRTKRLFRKVRDYEQVQLEVYMRMVDVHSATLLERLTDDVVHEQKHHVARNDELWDYVLAECASFCAKLHTLVTTPKHWSRWETGDTDTRRAVWEQIIVE